MRALLNQHKLRLFNERPEQRQWKEWRNIFLKEERDKWESRTYVVERNFLFIMMRCTQQQEIICHCPRRVARTEWAGQMRWCRTTPVCFDSELERIFPTSNCFCNVLHLKHNFLKTSKIFVAKSQDIWESRMPWSFPYQLLKVRKKSSTFVNVEP